MNAGQAEFPYPHIDPDLHEEAVRWVCRALMSERLDDYLTRRQVRDRAEQLVRDAETKAIPIDELVEWIHHPEVSGERSPAEWHRYCNGRNA